ncbi:MAG: hypothetical protein HY062_00490 [Bacteroidetes bacterium]|nr:hypothetical protein [Bacteroidota bacterium]
MRAKHTVTAFLCLLIIISCSRNKFDGKNGLKVILFSNSEDTCQVIEYKDGKKNGYLKEYYENGKLKIIQHFVDDKNVDTAKFFHPNGNLEAIQIYNNGEKAGCWEKYNPQGKLFSKICFENGVFHGAAYTYSYKSLNLIEKFNFQNGSKVGPQELFYNNGKPKSIAYYYYDRPGLGLKEWDENGNEINNDFAISYREQNKVNLENKLYYIISLENPEADDEVFRVVAKDTGNVITQYQRLEKRGDSHVLEFSVYPGGFVMEKVKLAAYRKTKFGNTFIKTISFNASANNF